MSMHKKIQVRDLNKSLHGHSILRDISFVVHAGEAVALIGSSGSGKSTLLRCIDVLTFPDSGSIQIDQQVLQFTADSAIFPPSQQIAQLRRKVGIVFQQFNLWPHMTLLENLIAAPIYVQRREKSAAITRARYLLERMGLAHKLASYPWQLSGGQQQRAAIARAWMMDPDIMLLDEPTSALDPEMVNEVLMVMQQLVAAGMTLLIATHALDCAACIAQRTIFLDQGAIIEQGETTQLFQAPQTARLQAFLQAMRQWRR